MSHEVVSNLQSPFERLECVETIDIIKEGELPLLVDMCSEVCNLDMNLVFECHMANLFRFCLFLYRFKRDGGVFIGYMLEELLWLCESDTPMAKGPKGFCEEFFRLSVVHID